MERSSPKDRADLMAGKNACSNSVLEVWHGHASSFIQNFGAESSASPLCPTGASVVALACLIMDCMQILRVEIYAEHAALQFLIRHGKMVLAYLK